MEIGISNRIRELRRQLGLTQTRLAEMLSTTQDTISLWELGKSYPDLESLVLMCGIFEVSADYLLGINKM